MANVLPSNRIHIIRSLFSDFPYDPGFIECITEGSAIGYRFLVDDDANPTLVIACHRLPVGFITGIAVHERLPELLAQATMPGEAWPVIRYISIPSLEWVSVFQRGFGYNWTTLDRVALMIDDPLPTHVQQWQEHIPSGYVVQQIDRELIHKVSAFDADFNACWPDIELFASLGLGYAVLHGEHVVSIAFSALPYGRYLEISTATDPEHRGRGLCGIACAPLLCTCRERNVIPLWNAFAANLPSLAAARKLGFIRKFVHPWLMHTPWNGTRKVVPVEQSHLQDYIGKYCVGDQWAIEIVQTNDGLAVRFVNCEPALPMLAEDITHFFLADRDVQFVFPSTGCTQEVSVIVQGSHYLATRQ